MIEHLPTLKAMLETANETIKSCEECYNAYQSNEYKNHFLWRIDEEMRKRDALEAVIAMVEKRDG